MARFTSLAISSSKGRDFMNLAVRGYFMLKAGEDAHFARI